jgi:hypothetical protein
MKWIVMLVMVTATAAPAGALDLWNCGWKMATDGENPDHVPDPLEGYYAERRANSDKVISKVMLYMVSGLFVVAAFNNQPPESTWLMVAGGLASWAAYSL